MLSPSEFRRLVSGERRGVMAALLRVGLAVAEVPYRYVVGLRNRRYDRGQSEIHHVDVPVICVGNLTMGGTGKTPMVQFLARWFRERNVRVGIVSRGYRANSGERNDEAKELSEKLPDVPHVQNSDRVAAATLAVDELDMQLILLDDGFQHRRLHRDLDIVLLDALEPFGFNHVFPRGMLREPLAGLARAHVAVMTRADLVTPATRALVRDRVLGIAPHLKWVEVAHHPTALLGRRQPEELQQLSGKRVLGFCGLGNPAGFRQTLEEGDFDLIDFREFPDHHHYTREDIEGLRKWVEQSQPDFLICTHKDLVKIDVDRIANVPLRAMLVEMRVLTGEAALLAALEPINAMAQRVTFSE